MIKIMKFIAIQGDLAMPVEISRNLKGPRSPLARRLGVRRVLFLAVNRQEGKE
jgi:hypothetical protein